MASEDILLKLYSLIFSYFIFIKLSFIIIIYFLTLELKGVLLKEN